MSQNAIPPPLDNGPSSLLPREDEDAMFEQDLAEMLQEGATLTDGGGGGGPAGGLGGAQMQAIPGGGGVLSFADVGTGRASIPPATSNISLTSPGSNGSAADAATTLDALDRGPFAGGSSSPPPPSSAPRPPTLQAGISAGTKLESLRAWSLNAYKCTRQILSEKLGKGQRTVDADLEASIAAVRDTQRRYMQVLRLGRALVSHARHAADTQRALAEAFAELAQRAPHLQPEFACNADSQRTIAKNADTLIAAMNFFTSSVNTLCNKTMEDTLQTVKQYETARIEYDAYRTDLEVLQAGPRDLAAANKVAEAKRKFDIHKDKYDKLRADVSIKLRFLEENKLKVMRHKLVGLQLATTAYYSGSHAELEAVMTEHGISATSAHDAAESPSWLEH